MKIFAVKGLWRIPGVRGAWEGAAFPSSNYVVAGTSDEAVEIVFQAGVTEWEEWRTKIRLLEKEGKLDEELENPFSSVSMPPSKPINREYWRAAEVMVPGYTIMVPPDEPSDGDPADGKAETVMDADFFTETADPYEEERIIRLDPWGEDSFI